MFFSLNLIESYGSGIRRAKDALLENGSPELKFYPDNEEDNYTNAVMGINAEFLKEFNGSATQETTQERILAAIQAKPEITQKELAQSIGITLDGIKYHIKNMTKLGVIKHEGSTKSGKWIITK